MRLSNSGRLKSCKYTLFATCILLLMSCKGEERPVKPDSLIGEHAMGTIIGDVLLLESYSSLKASEFDGMNAEVMLQYNYPLIDKKYGLADSQFVKSYQYYLNDPEALTRIFQVAMDTLTMLQNKVSMDADSILQK